MFVSHAKVRIAGLGARHRRRRPHRRRLAVKEVVRMPCLFTTSVTVFLGLLAVGGGAGMSVIGYVPKDPPDNSTLAAYYTLKTCSYIGPIVMAVGLFAMVMACVFYCEILDKYAILVPDRKAAIYDKKELYQVIVGEMKKSYAQTLITAYSKAAERSLLIDNPSSSGDYLPEPIFSYKGNEPLTIEQQIDIECEGYTPSPPIPNKRYSVIQARIQRLRSEDNWLKTSSLPNIRRTISIKRAGRVGAKIKDSRTLSYDYTMDEARLRRKSMMLRSLVHWNSESSDIVGQKQRRFSSVKALPSDRRASLDELHQGYGSFPLTRLIQRRGTFACGDMRTRRMKFLLLLEASESQDGFQEAPQVSRRASGAGIRRNSFIPYSTCDKFIAGEEKKTYHDRRRSSVNPFSFSNRFGNTVPQPGGRRHSFFPIRRESKIFAGDIHEQRRHSFNPIGVNNTFKSDPASMPSSRRASFNPETLPDRAGEIRGQGHVPKQSSRFLQVPGFEHDLLTERRPSTTSDDIPPKPEHSVSDSSFNYHRPGAAQPPLQGLTLDRQVERRHSFNPIVRLGPAEIMPNLKIPKITVNAEPTAAPSAGRFLAVPSQEFYIEERERRHSFNTPSTTKSSSSFTAGTVKCLSDKPSAQRISFKLGPDSPSTAHPPAPSSSQTISKPTLKPSKPTSEPVRPSSFKQEMVVFTPLGQADTRSLSPNSNVSCCGSERLGSERSTTRSRTASISSDRSAKTVLSASPASVVAADSVASYGTFKPPASAKATEVKKSSTQHGLAPSASDLSTSPRPAGGFVRKSASFRDTRGRGRGRHQQLQSDSPVSTSSGPATLSPSTTTDANAAIQRSKSASALPGIDTARALSPLPPPSYARGHRSPSPLVVTHKTGQQMDKQAS